MSNSTRILVDGMNLIYKFPDLTSFLVDSQLEEARQGLLSYLWQYYKEKKMSEVLVFFDGKKLSDADCYSEVYESMSVHYSHAKKADDLIIGYLTQTPIPSQCLVITSDKEIVNFARKVRAKRKTSEDFYTEWVSYFQAKEDAELNQIKEGLTEMPEQDYWAKQFLT
ncbi:NYN domain-containing protein [Leptospira ognonensis]|nr:NYN domain-containing protein [Leptospira ognonensis]